MSKQRVVGVSFDDDDVAPIVMLKAAGSQADTLLSKAHGEEIPVVRDAELLQQLYRVPMDQPIGRELFPVMAVLLAHVLYVDRQTVVINEHK